ncbi:hypothetical protein [Marivita hallyeonensis]|uniref:TFIIB zinc-binding n=1 Tax=Marivita hallyeonensis TaxID=996342 RepID=A0A1M5PD15_9RHOB|nr:hypothetical protein [Marivita hallyeonensis]SHG99369.1 hypothetical protein SAMN05443551_1241 [Marivita hallyeonensis]
MPHGTKIATCCYCGTRAALVLRGQDRHELSCAACGAPLHDMKMLPSAKVQTPVSTTEFNPARPVKKERTAGVTPLPSWERKLGTLKKKKKKKRKTLAKRFFEEAFDVLEDIFD